MTLVIDKNDGVVVVHGTNTIEMVLFVLCAISSHDFRIVLLLSHEITEEGFSFSTTVDNKISASLSNINSFGIKITEFGKFSSNFYDPNQCAMHW